MDFRVFVEPQQGATYDQQLAVAQTAESLGFSAFFRSDHYLAMVAGKGSGVIVGEESAGSGKVWIKVRAGREISQVLSKGVKSVQMAKSNAVDELKPIGRGNRDKRGLFTKSKLSMQTLKLIEKLLSKDKDAPAELQEWIKTKLEDCRSRGSSKPQIGTSTRALR